MIWIVVQSHSGPFTVDIIEENSQGENYSPRYGNFKFIAKNLKSLSEAQTIVDAHNSSVQN